VATGGQGEIDMRFAPLVEMGDKVLKYEYVIKNVAAKYGKPVTFMPKPIFNDNGSGMHTHLSIWNGGENLFAGDGYAGMSEMAMHAIGGVLQHAAAVLRLHQPDHQQLQAAGARLRGAGEPGLLAAATAPRRSASRCTPTSEKAKRIEFRTPDPTCNPYLSFAACLMAGLDGIQNKIDPGEPLDKDLYDLPAEEALKVKQLPGSLGDVLDELEKDHEFLLKGDVFTKGFIENWLEYKRKNEVDALRLRPHPWEFALYFDI